MNQKRPTLFTRWRNRRSPQTSLADVLAEVPEERTASEPFTAGISSWRLIFGLVPHGVVLVALGVGLRFAGVTLRPSATGVAIACALALMTVAALVFQLGSFARQITISEQGIRVERLFSTNIVEWWMVRAVSMPDDLSAARIVAERVCLVALDGLRLSERPRLALALRARLLQRQNDLTRESTAADRLHGMTTAAPGVALGIGLMAAVYTGDILFGKTLGIRCSGPSSYLSARFGVPNRAGCVVLRVSAGAARSGVKQGDLMIAMGGVPVTSGRSFSDPFYATIGDNYVLDFTFLRAGSPDPIQLRVDTAGGSNFSEDKADPLTWFLRARGDAETDIDQDIADYSKAIELAPDFDLAYLYGGHLHLMKDEFDDAKADYERSLVLNPSSAETNRRLGELHQGMIFEDASISKLYLERAIQLDQCDRAIRGENLDCSIDYTSLSYMLYFRTDHVGAIAAAKQAIEFYPRNADPLFSLAEAYAFLKDYDEAESYARQYLARPSSQRDPARTNGVEALLKRIGRA